MSELFGQLFEQLWNMADAYSHESYCGKALEEAVMSEFRDVPTEEVLAVPNEMW